MNISLNFSPRSCGSYRPNPYAAFEAFPAPMLGMMVSMMAMMRQMMAGQGGNFPMPMQFGGFGMPPGGGLGMAPMGCGGFPSMGNFLGSCSNMGNSGPMMSPISTPSGFGHSDSPSSNHCQGSTGNENLGPIGPAGDVGNLDVARLVAALPASRRKSAQQHFPYILAEARKQGVTNKAQLAYILATATHESGAGAFMEEFASGKAYEGRSSLGNTQSGDGVRYKGRGYVQLTGRRNYQDWSKRLGLDLVGNPNLVKDPRVAAQILVGGMKKGTFTGKGLDSYINDGKTDFVGARRTVNGTDRAGSIAGIAQKLLQAMG